MLQRTVEQTLEQSVVAVRSVHAEHLVDELIPRNLEESVEAAKGVPQEQFSERNCEQSVDVNFPELEKSLFET